MSKLDKFKDYEDRLNNHQVIDYMIKVRLDWLGPKEGKPDSTKRWIFHAQKQGVRRPISSIANSH